MTTKNFTREQISAFADGELTDGQFDAMVAVLKTADGREAWAAYHEIGDVLRSDDMAQTMSPDFASRLMARLDDEPTVVAPVAAVAERAVPQPANSGAAGIVGRGKRFALRGMAAAAVAAMAFVAVPQIMDATKTGNLPGAAGGVELAATTIGPSDAVAPEIVPVAEMAGDDGEILRSADVDEYLLAHQRSSPSVYSTVQYARSATFAVDSEK